MQDLEEYGLLASPHTSAGRLPTEQGLRLFVDGMRSATRRSARSWKSWSRRPRNSQKSRSEEHTSELQSLMRISYAVFCLKKKKNKNTIIYDQADQIQYR